MRRREFLKATGAAMAAAHLPARAAEPGGRLIFPINRGWQFRASKSAQFEPAVLPHTNVRLPWHNFNDTQYEFLSTYRRSFRLPEAARGRRVFIDFEGAMTASTVLINGVNLGEYKGGYTPFSFELTEHLRDENMLEVRLDSTERADIPPFGYEIDYMTFGGIYREASLRVVPDAWIDNIFARPQEVLGGAPGLEVDCFLAGAIGKGLALQADLMDGERVVATGRESVRAQSGADPDASLDPMTVAPAYQSTETQRDPARHTVSLPKLSGIELWSLSKPKLYTVRVRLLRGGSAVDEDVRRVGFRDARFTPEGFKLNGEVIKLRGLDRHPAFPYVGYAMPGRVQRRDVQILKQIHCNLVRTSHYPQSRHFLDACDEVGLLVLEAIPGWQQMGPEPWKQTSIDNVGRMIRRDWNHPSVVLWGVRINESPDDHDFYTRTNALAHALDPTRQTGGIRNFKQSELLEDVFTINDFDFPLRAPNHPLYLNTEFVGHTYPVKTTDDDERQREHTLRHARIHDQLASDPGYAGGLGWCAFDYNTHSNFGAGDRVCYHGVLDIFREPKPAAGFYKSQVDPAEEIVLEPAFHWAKSDEATGFRRGVVCSNCDHLKFFLRERSLESNPWTLIAELDPDRQEFQHLKYPPFQLDLFHVLGSKKLDFSWGDLRIDGFLNGKQVISRSFSGDGTNHAFSLTADDKELLADGADTTRVVLRVTDQFGNVRPLADDPVTLTLEGPAELIGDSPFVLTGGTGAVWVRAKEQAGAVKLTAKHPLLGEQTVAVTMMEAKPEPV